VQVWNCSRGVADRRVHDFFESDHFTGGILPIPGKHPTFSSWSNDLKVAKIGRRSSLMLCLRGGGNAS
jgi:hypothetical protein